MNPLDTLVRELESYSGAEDPISFAPSFEALGRDTKFLTEFLRAAVEQTDFQKTNFYNREEAIIVAERRNFYVLRLAAWPADPKHPHYTDPHAHTHPFDLLLFGVLGPGYETIIYEFDPEKMCKAAIGDKVTLTSARSEHLNAGRLLFLPAFKVAHIQRVPESYSISLSLNLFKPANPFGYVQCYVDPVTGIKQVDSSLPKEKKWYRRLLGGS